MLKRTTVTACGTSFFMALGAGYAGEALGQDADITVVQENQSELPAGQGVEVGAAGQITITVADLDITRVLQLLSMQSQRNIVASRNVSGTVSAALYDVDFYEALDAILIPNGFGYRESGNFIYVYTSEEIREIEAAERVPETRLFQLDYIPAESAKELVEPLLSENGAVVYQEFISDGIDVTTANSGANSMSSGEYLFIRDYAENIDEIAEIVALVDVRPPQVQVDATILQARVTEDTEFGTDFSIVTDLSLTDFTAPLDAFSNLLAGGNGTTQFDSGNVIQSTVGGTAAPGGFKVGILSDDAAVYVRALQGITDTTVLSSPSVLVLNRQRADLLVGQRLGYVTTTRTETSDSETVDFLEVGTQLTVRPFVSTDGYIRLELSPSVSDGSTFETAGGTIVPNENTQRVTTNVIVQSGQTVVLGGLFKESTTVQRTQIPFWGDIPILGAAGRGQDDQVQRDEVIFMVKPTIMHDEALIAGGQTAMEAVHDIQVGARDGLLPWSHVALTSSHMQNAIEAYEAGDNDRALWCANMALYLDPTLVEALQLREVLLGEETYLMEDSILGDVIESMVEDEVGDEEAVQAVEEAVDAQVLMQSSEAEFESFFGETAEPVTSAFTAEPTAVEDKEQAPAEVAAETPAPVETQPQAEVEAEASAEAEHVAEESAVVEYRDAFDDQEDPADFDWEDSVMVETPEN